MLRDVGAVRKAASGKDKISRHAKYPGHGPLGAGGDLLWDGEPGHAGERTQIAGRDRKPEGFVYRFLRWARPGVSRSDATQPRVINTNVFWMPCALRALRSACHCMAMPDSSRNATRRRARGTAARITSATRENASDSNVSNELGHERRLEEYESATACAYSMT